MILKMEYDYWNRIKYSYAKIQICKYNSLFNKYYVKWQPKYGFSFCSQFIFILNPTCFLFERGRINLKVGRWDMVYCRLDWWVLRGDNYLTEIIPIHSDTIFFKFWMPLTKIIIYTTWNQKLIKNIPTWMSTASFVPWELGIMHSKAFLT